MIRLNFSQNPLDFWKIIKDDLFMIEVFFSNLKIKISNPQNNSLNILMSTDLSLGMFVKCFGYYIRDFP